MKKQTCYLLYFLAIGIFLQISCKHVTPSTLKYLICLLEVVCSSFLAGESSTMKQRRKAGINQDIAAREC